MITYDDALTAREFWHMTMKNADGTPLRARRNGKTHTWKRRPGEFNIPVKHGLRDCFIISHTGAADWCTAEKWPAEHVLYEGLATTVLSPTARNVAQLEQARKAFKQDPTPALAAIIKLLEKGLGVS